MLENASSNSLTKLAFGSFVVFGNFVTILCMCAFLLVGAYVKSSKVFSSSKKIKLMLESILL